MGITVLGPLTVDGSGHLSPRDRVVLAALAARSGQPVSTDQLTEALWADCPPASAGKILQGCIVRLRKVLGSAAVETLAHGYLLALPPDQIDAQRFERLVVRARELLGLGEADRAAYQLTEALSLWRGAAYPELEEWAPAVSEGRRLGELRLEAEELRVEALLRVGRHQEVLAEVQAMVRAAPLRERRWVLMAQAQYQAGNQGEALRTLHQLKSVLATKLGVDPGPDVSAIEQAILRQDPSLLAGGPVVPISATCPYQGLQAFDLDDADRFFGRQRDIEACLSVMGRTPLLVLVGPSGSGKSSLLRAGISATLHARGIPTLTITPGARPLESLTELSSSPARAVLLVDQFEEVFTLDPDPTQQRQFLDAVVAESAHRSVAIAVRADRLTDLSAHPDFARLAEMGLYIVGALTEEGLAEAIEAPARQAGLLVEHGLIDLLVGEVKDEPGALPLLSHVLLETWQRREGNTLTVSGYRASGGIHGAVAQSAELLYSRIEVDQRHLLRDLVLRLVSPGLQGEPVRSRVPRRQVATDEERDRLIEMLVAARLVTSDDGVLELTHEALARAWPRLRGWLDDDIEGQRMLHHLAAAADAWDSLGRPDSELYRGVRLARIRAWQDTTSSRLTDTESDFLAASQSQAEKEERSARDQARAQARLIRRLRGVLTGAVVLLVLALAAGGMAAFQSKRAGDNATAAGAAARSAMARGAATRAGTSEAIDTALLLGVAAARIDPSPETLSGLTSALARYPALVRSSPLSGEETMALDVDPRAQVAAALDNAHHLRLVALATGRERVDAQVGAARAETDETRVLKFSPDGDVLAVGMPAFSKQPVRLLDARSLRPLAHQLTGTAGRMQVVDLGFSEDGTSLVIIANRFGAPSDGQQLVGTSAYAWQLERASQPVRVDLNGDSATTGVLSPDGELLYTSSDAVRVHDLTTGSVRRLKAETGYLDLSPDGRWLAVAQEFAHPRDGESTLVLDSATGRVRHTLVLDGGSGVARFSDDGRRLLTVGWDFRPAAVWDVRTGAQLARLDLGLGSPLAVDLDTSGSRVESAGADGSLRSWDVDGEDRYLRRMAIRGLPWGIGEFGSWYAATSSGGEFVSYGVPLQDHPTEVRVVVDVARRRASPGFDDPNGYGYGTGSWYGPRAEYVRPVGGRILTWDGRTGRRVIGPRPSGREVVEIDHSPDGSELAIVELSGAITRLDPATLSPDGEAVDLGAASCCVALGPDNRTAFALVGGPDRFFFWNTPSDRWALVDLEAGRIVRDGELGIGNGAWAAYAPDGRHVAAGGYEGDVVILDVETGEPVRAPVRAHHDFVGWMAFSPDGSRLVSAAADGSVALWDVATSTILATLTAPNSSMSSPEFLPNGNLLIAPWHDDPAVYEWDPSTERAIEFACRAAGRELSEEEWRDSFGDLPYREVCSEA